MNTDRLDRPVSDDGQWVWNGVAWIPNTGADSATSVSNNPLQSGGAGYPAAGYGDTRAASSYGAGSQPGGAPGYGVGAPAYGVGTPYGPSAGYYGGSPSRRPLLPWIAGGAAAVIVLVIVLILSLGGGGGSQSLTGTYSCSAPGVTATGTITFTGNKYAISQGNGGTFTHNGSTVTFTGGDLNGTTANFDSGTNVLSGNIQGTTITCKK